MANSKFIDEPIDDEERALMEAVENDETVPLSHEEEERIRADIMSASQENGEGRGHALPDAHQFHHPPLRDGWYRIQGRGVG